MAKAENVCKLNTRCSIIATCNPKNNSYNTGQSMTENTGMTPPLLSRFDIILVLLDNQNEDRDRYDS